MFGLVSTATPEEVEKTYKMTMEQCKDWEREAATGDDKEKFQTMMHLLTDMRTAIYEHEFKVEAPEPPVLTASSSPLAGALARKLDDPGNSDCGARKRPRGTAGEIAVQPTAGGAAPSGATPHAVWEWQPGSPQKAKDSFRIQRHAAMSRALADYRDHRGRGWEEVLVRCLARVRGTRLSTSSSPEPRRRMPHPEAHPPKGGRRTLTALAR